VVVNTISYVAANAIGIGVALAMLDARGRTSPALLAASAAFVLTVSMLAVLLFRLTRPGAWPPRRLTRLGPVPRALKLLRRARPHLVRSRALLAYCTSLQLAILLLDAGTVGVLIQALGHSPSPSGVFVSFMVSTLVRLIVPIPGGLGAFEAASVGALSLTGVKLSVALAATLLFRVLSFWLPMVPGLWLSHREGRPARGSPPGRTRRAPAPGALPGSGSRGTPTGRRARG
jgi:Mg2+-importing ATPase